jgi:membrane protease YdiL (CAAX protease family)
LGICHFPAYLIGTGTPREMSFLVFLLWVVLGTLFISWIYYYTESVLTSILARISANADLIIQVLCRKYGHILVVYPLPVCIDDDRLLHRQK